MNETNLRKLEDDAYRKNLETLVTARTNQLKQAMSRNSFLMEFLKRIQSMQSLEEIHEAVRTEVEKLDSEIPTLPPQFGGKPGEPVPEVDLDDLRAIRELYQEAQKAHPDQNFGIEFDLMKNVCKPGADVQAIWYRMSQAWVLSQVAKEQLAPWTKEGEIDDAVYRTIATIPMEWIGRGQRQGLPFDADEFFRRLNQDQPGRTHEG